MRWIIYISFSLSLAFSNVSYADQGQETLDHLFMSLKHNKNLIRFADIKKRIWIHWYELPEDSKALQPIFNAGMRALAFGQTNIAIVEFSKVISAAPNFSEGWNRRATAFFIAGDFESSMADIKQTLILESRHFGAISGLSIIFETTSHYQRAIDAENLLLDLMPHSPDIRKRIERLKKMAAQSQI